MADEPNENSVRRTAGNICSNDHHFVVPGPRDIDCPANPTNGAGAACNHVGSEFGIIGIANHDPKRKRAGGED